MQKRDSLCWQKDFADKLVLPSAYEYRQERAEDFRIGVALTLFALEACEIFLSDTPKFLTATPSFRLVGVALRIKCSARAI